MNAGTIGTPARRAITSKPRWMAISWPVREMCPSGKIATTSPADTARIAFRIPSEGFVREMESTPASRKPRSNSQWARRPS